MRKVRIYIIYFPIILVSCQVLANLFGFLLPDYYSFLGFYLNTFLGTNVLFSIFLLVFVYSYKFCFISRWCAIAEFLFAMNYMVVREDNLYNMMFQLIVGGIAIIGTYRYYIIKFPICTISLIHIFFSGLIKTGSCEKALDRFERNITAKIEKRIINERVYSNNH